MSSDDNGSTSLLCSSVNPYKRDFAQHSENGTLENIEDPDKLPQIAVPSGSTQFFLFYDSKVIWSDGFPVLIHCICKEASTRAKKSLVHCLMFLFIL